MGGRALASPGALMGGSLHRLERPGFNALLARRLRDAVDGAVATAAVADAVERGVVAPESIALLAAVVSAVPSPHVRVRVAAAVNPGALTMLVGGPGVTHGGRRGARTGQRVVPPAGRPSAGVRA